MGSWIQKPKKDWSLEPKRYLGTPLMPIEVVRRYNAKLAAERKPDPFVVMAGGLRHGDHLFIDCLETRNSDRLDFHDVSVWAVKSALMAAYQAGRKAAKQD